jgi:hypothetical protein
MKGLKQTKWQAATAAFGLIVLTALSGGAGEIQKPTPTPYSMDLYGGIAGAIPGDAVTVYDPQGTLCGAFTIRLEGRYGFLHVYGDDQATPADEGAKLREPLQFKLNGAPLTPLAGEPVLWLGDGQVLKVDFRR